MAELADELTDRSVLFRNRPADPTQLAGEFRQIAGDFRQIVPLLTRFQSGLNHRFRFLPCPIRQTHVPLRISQTLESQHARAELIADPRQFGYPTVASAAEHHQVRQLVHQLINLRRLDP